MNIERRMKYKGQGKTVNKTNSKIDIVFDLNTLNLMCSYIISDNKNIKRGALVNLRNLMSMLDLSAYQNDTEKIKMINFINKGLEARLIKNLNNSMVIMKYINGGIIDGDYIDRNSLKILSNEELQWINETVSNSLKYSFIYNDIDKLIDICTRFKACNYINRGAIVDELEELLKEMMTKFRRVNMESITETTFTLREGLFQECVSDVYDQLSNPGNRIITGMQGLNELLGGAFETTRMYMLFGIAGIGKSLTMLDLAYQIKKYNRFYRCQDPTKKPVVVYLTQENTVRESVDRLFSMVMGNVTNMAEYSKEDVINILRDEGELFLSDESPIDIIIKFMPNNSIDTSYLYTLTEDLEDEGYEVICLMQDHIKRIRPVFRTGDLRIDLGTVVNEMKTFGQLKNCVVISISHLNRDANRTIEGNSNNGRNSSDLTKMLGRSSIGESMLMIDNLDGAFIIGQDYDAEGNKYLSFNRIKERFKCTDRYYISQPYLKNSIKLAEDYNLPSPLFKDSLKEAPIMNTYVNNIYNNANVPELSKVINNDGEEIKDSFNGASYSSDLFSSIDDTLINNIVYANDIEAARPIKRKLAVFNLMTTFKNLA